MQLSEQSKNKANRRIDSYAQGKAEKGLEREGLHKWTSRAIGRLKALRFVRRAKVQAAVAQASASLMLKLLCLQHS